MQASEKLIVDSIRTLSMDGVQKANSGHPGAAMALAPASYVLWHHIMKHNPSNPAWIDRDRFILSNGHASMLIYSSLFVSGYNISLDDLKQFRQLDSITPGHPEHGITPGVETTTGPLGQGFMNGVGMAMAEAHLAARYNRPGHKIVDHYTYAICSDGDLMEGASHEAASLAGHLGLGKLIYLYDDNHITIEGDTDIAFSEDVEKRFESYGWHVQNLGESANDLDTLKDAFKTAKSEENKPSLIILRTHIGYGSPNKVDTASAHGSPLGAEEVLKTKEVYGWPSEEPFYVPDEVYSTREEIVKRGEAAEKSWEDRFEAYASEFPDLAASLKAAYEQRLPEGWDSEVPSYGKDDKALATRALNSVFINAVKDKLPWLMGGSADLEPSTKTMIKGHPYFSKDDYTGRNLGWGIREMAMCAASTGMSLHGGVRVYAATFFVFTDYCRAAIRLAALMHQPIIYVMTHDSIGLGEDGPTHQPVEHLASLRAMPNLTVIRPADANEALEAWKAAIQRTDGPTLLVLSRQGIPILDTDVVAPASNLHKGAYTLSAETGDTPQAILIATGSEVGVAMEAQEILKSKNIDARVVSMPSWELFEEQDAAYKSSVLPAGVPVKVAIEPGSTLGWHKYVGDHGAVIGIDRFGISAPYEEIYKRFGLTAEDMAAKVEELLG